MKVISVVTLGVSDLDESTSFYERIGYVKSKKSSKTITFFRTGGTTFALYPRGLLAEDVNVNSEGSGFRGFTLAINLRSKEEVDSFFEEVVRAGATPVKRPQKVFWGGYSSYFSDPDGHLWEVVWNPYTEVDDAGKNLVDE